MIRSFEIVNLADKKNIFLLGDTEKFLDKNPNFR